MEKSDAEKSVMATFVEAMGDNVCEGSALPELAATLVSQRDNAYNEANVHKRNIEELAKAIGDLVVQCGIINPGTRLTGPQVLMGAADVKSYLARLLKIEKAHDEADSVLARLEDTAKGFEGDLVTEARSILAKARK